MIDTKLPWLQQPPAGAARPNPKFGFTGLWSFADGASARNLVTGKPVSFVGATGNIMVPKSTGLTIFGNGFGSSDAFEEADLETGTTELVPGTACTFFWYGMLQSLLYGGLLSRGDDASGNGSSLRLRITTGGEVSWSYVDTSPAAVTATTSGAAITADIPVFIVATKAGTRVAAFSRGRSASATGGNGALRTSGRGLALNFAGSSSDPTNNAGAVWHSIVGVLPYALSDEVAEEIANGPPWPALFAPRSERIWVPPPAGGGFKAAWVRNRSQVIGAGVN